MEHTMCVCKTCGETAPSHGTPKSLLAAGWFSWCYCTRACRIEDEPAEHRDLLIRSLDARGRS